MTRETSSDGGASLALLSTTASSAEEARMLARTLVEKRLAACVQILPMESVYRWREAVEEASEWLLVCKIRSEDFTVVQAAILTQHSYELPEIVLTPIVRGSENYLAWIADSTKR